MRQVLENDLIGGDRDSVFGILAQLKLDEKNLEEIQGFIGKYKNLEGSIKTLVGNLNSYEDNKVKEKSTMP